MIFPSPVANRLTVSASMRAQSHGRHFRRWSQEPPSGHRSHLLVTGATFAAEEPRAGRTEPRLRAPQPARRGRSTQRRSLGAPRASRPRRSRQRRGGAWRGRRRRRGWSALAGRALRHSRRDRARPAGLRVRLARRAVRHGGIHLRKVRSEDRLADVVTKALPEPLRRRRLSQLCTVYGARAPQAQAGRVRKCRVSSA